MRPGGFKRRIVLALLLTAATPLLASLYLADRLADEPLSLGINPMIGEALEGAVAAYPELFRTRRALHAARTDLAAADPLLRPGATDRATVLGRMAELCRTDPFLRTLALTSPRDAPIEHACEVRPDGPERKLTLERPREGGGRLSLTFAMEEAHYQAFQDLAERSELYGRLGERRDALKRAYRLAFLALLGGWVTLAGVGGFLLARGTTRRLEHVAEATRRVAAGDLDVEVPVKGKDELAALADAFNRMVREIKSRGDRIVYLEKISSWQEIARRLAHEIKNPLTPIQLSMQQLVSRYDGSDPKFQRLLDDVSEIVQEEVGTLRRLVTEFHDFARLPDVAPENIDLAAWVREFVRAHPDLAGEAEIDIQTPAVPVWAPVDRPMLGRVLVNLLHNAVQAAQGAGLPPRIVITLGEERAGTWVTVEDEGPGIPAELMPRIFDPYFTTKETGTGLGLPICKKIILQHEGEISVAARPGGGSVFTIRLPATVPGGRGDAGPASDRTGGDGPEGVKGGGPPTEPPDRRRVG